MENTFSKKNKKFYKKRKHFAQKIYIINIESQITEGEAPSENTEKEETENRKG